MQSIYSAEEIINGGKIIEDEVGASLRMHKKNSGKVMNTRFKKAIILLEHEGQVKNCSKRLKEIKGRKLIVALSPFAMYELEKRGLSYEPIEDYYSSKELYKLGINNYKKVENLCDIIDTHIQNACPTTAELSIRPALFSFYYLKIVYDAATIRLYQLSKLIDAENPDVLCIYDGKRYPFGISEMAPYLFYDNRESIYARLLACEGWGIPVTVLPHVPYLESPDVQNTSKKKMARRLQRYPELYDLAVEAHKRGWRGLLDGLKNYLRAGKGARLFLFGTGYNWDDCREELKSVGISPLFIRMRDNLEYWVNADFPDKDASVLSEAWKGLQADDSFRKFFTWGRVDFFPVVEERLRFLVEGLTPVCLNTYEKTAEVLKKIKVKAFLASTFANPTTRSAAQAARNSKVPVVTWQHGSYGYVDQPMIPYNDLNSDVHFVFGEGVADKYTKPARRLGTRLISIGSPSLETLFQMQPPDKAKKIIKSLPKKKIVLYVSTNFYQNNLYISFPPPFSDNDLWRTQQAVLDVLAKHHNYTVVVKTHPTHIYRDSPIRLYAEGKKFKNCQFIRDECDFTDLLPIADMFVIDFPSTTLLQALTTSKPIFVYTGHLYIDAQAQKLLERRAFCYRELKELANALDKYLSTGRIEKRLDMNDRKFLKAYGTSSLEGGSGARAAKMLRKIMLR